MGLFDKKRKPSKAELELVRIKSELESLLSSVDLGEATLYADRANDQLEYGLDALREAKAKAEAEAEARYYRTSARTVRHA